MSPTRYFAATAFLTSLVVAACSSGVPQEPNGDGGAGGDKGGGIADGLNQGTGSTGSSIDDLKAAAAPVTCGDGILNDTEACDDGNKDSGDGCWENCLVVEPGYTCSVPGEECKPFAKCGDGVLRFPEQCDDGNLLEGDGTLIAGDGCSPNCKMEIGWKCTGAPSECSHTKCGDSVKEGAEGCDDGNSLPFDGCDSNCQIEPSCTAGSGCTSACGDGVVLPYFNGAPYEQCDDGNTTPGDGCSDTCQKEEGYICEAECEEIGGECVLRVPVVFRDFLMTHADMKPEDGYDRGCKVTGGLVNSSLDLDGKPVRSTGTGTTDTECWQITDLSSWYRDDAAKNSTIVSDIVLFSDGAGNFVNRFDSTTGAKYGTYDGNPTFFPLDGIPTCDGTTLRDCTITPPAQYLAAAVPPEYGGDWGKTSGSHNFHFTSEIVYWFQYDAGTPATLSFVGDDDVWVFINGTLATSVDLGGVHAPSPGSVTIGPATASLYGLQDGNVYEIKVFHAERKAVGSSFKLTLGNFNTGRSECLADCGDGIIGAGEECDDVVNDGGYNECQPGCVLGGFCGDGIKQENETCDDNDPEAPAGCSGCRILLIK